MSSAKFQIGDLVNVVGNAYNGEEVGNLGIVVDISDFTTAGFPPPKTPSGFIYDVYMQISQKTIDFYEEELTKEGD